MQQPAGNKTKPRIKTIHIRSKRATAKTRTATASILQEEKTYKEVVYQE